MYLLKNMDFHLKQLYQLELILEKEIEVRQENQEILFNDLKKFSSENFYFNKYYFQILSLLFLLLLFRNLIINKDQ